MQVEGTQQPQSLGIDLVEGLRTKKLASVEIGGETFGNMLLPTDVKFKCYVVIVI